MKLMNKFNGLLTEENLFEEVKNLFIIGDAIKQEIMENDIDIINIMTLSNKYGRIIQKIGRISSKYVEWYSNFLTPRMITLHSNILFLGAVLVNEEYMNKLKNKDNKDSGIKVLRECFQKDIELSSITWNIPSVFSSEIRKLQMHEFTQSLRNDKYAIIINDDNSIFDLDQYTYDRSCKIFDGSIISFPKNVNEIYVLFKLTDKKDEKDFNDVYLKIFKSEVKIAGIKTEMIIMMTEDVNHFIYELTAIPLDKKLQKIYSCNYRLEDVDIDKYVRLEMNYMNIDKDIYSVNINHNDFIRYNRYTCTSKILLNIELLKNILNGFEKKSKSKSMGSKNDSVFHLRKRAEGNNDNEYKLVKLETKTIVETGEGTPHRFHASPRRHIRKGHWRRRSKLDPTLIWIESTIVNKDKKPTLYSL